MSITDSRFFPVTSEWTAFKQTDEGPTLSVQEVLRETVSVKRFGAAGDGVADDTAAFNAAIAWANAKGGNDRANIKGSTIFIPEGRYKITAALNPITVSSVYFVGASQGSAVMLVSSNAELFTFGDSSLANTPVGGGVKGVKIEYPAGPTGSATVFKVDYAFGLRFKDIMLEKIGTLASLGQTSSRIAGDIAFENVSGSVANAGYTLFDLRFGAGLKLSNFGVFVSGVLAPVHPASMTTVLGTTVFKCETGFWDTLKATNCIFERFDVGLGITATAGMVYQNFLFENTVMDYFKRWTVYMEANGGVISTIQFGATCWHCSWEESAIEVIRVTGFNDGHRFNGNVTIAGKYGLKYQVANAKLNSFENMKFSACNRLNTVQAAMLFVDGSKGFTVTGCKGNHDTTSVGLPWRADFGITVGVDCDEYMVSGNTLEGTIGGYSFAANTTASDKRKAFNNINANYAGHKTQTIPASGVRYTNKTPFVEEWNFFGGTITGGYDKNNYGFPGALPYAHFRLQPNESFSVGYSAPPTIQVFVEA